MRGVVGWEGGYDAEEAFWRWGLGGGRVEMGKAGRMERWGWWRLSNMLVGGRCRCLLFSLNEGCFDPTCILLLVPFRLFHYPTPQTPPSLPPDSDESR